MKLLPYILVIFLFGCSQNKIVKDKWTTAPAGIYATVAIPDSLKEVAGFDSIQILVVPTKKIVADFVYPNRFFQTVIPMFERKGDSIFVNDKFDHTILTYSVDTFFIATKRFCGHARDSLLPCITIDTTTGVVYRNKKHK